MGPCLGDISDLYRVIKPKGNLENLLAKIYKSLDIWCTPLVVLCKWLHIDL